MGHGTSPIRLHAPSQRLRAWLFFPEARLPKAGDCRSNTPLSRLHRQASVSGYCWWSHLRIAFLAVMHFSRVKVQRQCCVAFAPVAQMHVSQDKRHLTTLSVPFFPRLTSPLSTTLSSTSSLFHALIFLAAFASQLLLSYPTHASHLASQKIWALTTKCCF